MMLTDGNYNLKEPIHITFDIDVKVMQRGGRGELLDLLDGMPVVFDRGYGDLRLVTLDGMEIFIKGVTEELRDIILNQLRACLCELEEL